MLKEENFYLSHLKERKLFFTFLIVIGIFASICGILGLTLLIPSIFSSLEIKESAKLFENQYFQKLSFIPLKAEYIGLLLAFSFIIVKNTLFVLLNYLTFQYKKKWIVKFRKTILKKLFEAQNNFIKNSSLIKISKILDDDISKTGNAFSQIIRLMIFYTQLIIYIAATLYINWKIGLIALIVFSFFALLRKKILKKIRGFAKKSINSSIRLYKKTVERLHAFEQIKISGKSKEVTDLISKESQVYESNRVKTQFTQSSVQNMIEVFGFLSVLTIIFISKQLFSSSIQANDFFIVMLILLRCVPIINQSIQFSTNISEAQESILKVKGLLSNLNDHKEKVWGNKPLQEIKNLRVRSLTHHYKNPETPVLQIEDLVFKRESTLLLGQSGSGKSTLVQILAGLNESEEGSLIINNKDSKHFNKKSYQKRIAYMGQKIFLINASVFKNLEFLATHNLSEEDAMKALEKAELKKEILSLPKGIHNSLGENGSKLSGGEAQRIALAQIMIQNPDLILMDEATSSLDPETEEKIVKTMIQLFQNKILVFISHNPGLKKHFDRSIELRNGKIVNDSSVLQSKIA